MSSQYELAGTEYVVIASLIFASVSYTFLFPCNVLIPLDRRTIALVGSLLCYLSRVFIFPNNRIDLLDAVDFDVLVLLASIMVINHIVIHLKETKNIISYIQNVIQNNPIRGFWLVSFATFVVSPFLTNDGVCLLFVEPILNSFRYIKDTGSNEAVTNRGRILHKSDAIYFLLALACSANIGSSLTYTGNPQNMIVASDAIGVMPSYKFLMYMILPATFTWLMTIKWIEYCWFATPISARKDTSIHEGSKAIVLSEHVTLIEEGIPMTENPMKTTREKDRSPLVSEQLFIDTSKPYEKRRENDSTAGGSILPSLSPDQQWLLKTSTEAKKSPEPSINSPISPRRRRAKEREEAVSKVITFVTSPVPYLTLGILVAMIIMIFVDILPISALLCISAILMIVTIVLGSHWRGLPVWNDIEVPESENDANKRYSKRKNEYQSLLDNHKFQPLTREERQDNLNDFFEEIFKAIDYSLLVIFLGTFIVIENMNSTGVPGFIWSKIVGKVPFQDIQSILGISTYVLLSSQFLGNVPVIQLALPNVSPLADPQKRLAWAVISFVATVGGNLTITGSAANIIVIEKAARLDPDMTIDFFCHFKVCFWVTLLSCIIGGAMVSAIVMFDNSL